MALHSVAVVLGVYATLIAFLVWVCVISDPNDQASLGGRLNVLLTENAPERINATLQRVLPQRFVKRCIAVAGMLEQSSDARSSYRNAHRAYGSLHRTYDYVVNQRNPLLQVTKM